MGWTCGLNVHTKAKLRLLKAIAMVIALTAFDIRDLVYKLLWLGPYDSYKFSATGDNVVDTKPLTLAVNLTTPGQAMDRPNGWSSLLEKCPRMYPSGDVFRVVLAENCTVGSKTHPLTIPQLVLASAVRVDSIAWACCRLLPIQRQPNICNEQIARDFLNRYFMEAANVPASWFVQPNSKEEDELLELLDVIATSYSSAKITCVEGFVYTGPGRYRSTLVGCGSPNHFRSAFAGVHATKLHELMFDKTYLTLHDINIMGFHYSIRQNCISDFDVQHTASGQLNVVYTTIINFSTYGQLYALQIINDVALMVLNVLSALQVGFSLVVPAFRSESPHGVDNFLREGYASFLECTLYRSPVIIAMITISQLLSWLLVLPNSVIWNWGISLTGKVQAYLTTLRLWTLVLIVLNLTWDFFVFLKEDLAYRIAKYTFLMPAEIIFVGAAVSYLNRKQIFDIEFQINAILIQRQLDDTSFQHYMGASNAYNPELDHKLSTTTEILWIAYKPLFSILLYSLTAVVAYAVLKYCVYFWTPLGKGLHQNHIVSAPELQAISIVEAFQEARDAMASKRLAVQPSSRSLGTFVHFSECERSFVPEGSAETRADARTGPSDYVRLPLESMLNTPIRARSLTRSSLQLDHVVNHERFVSAQLYLEFGVFFIDGRMKPRWGFQSPIPPVIQVDNTVISDMIQPLSPDELLKRRRSVAKMK